MAAVAETPGNFTIVLGDDEAKRKLRRATGEIDDWLYEMADASAFYASERLEMHAPGNIKLLVSVDVAHETEPGHFEATAGVEPDFDLSQFGKGLGSDPADYPVYVDQGTGIYGSRRSPITTIPGYFMGPIPWRGRDIYVRSFKGQKAQHYSDRSFDDTITWIPVQIEAALPDLERKIKT